MRNFFLLAGLLQLVLAWVTPLPKIAGDTFWGHMTIHMIVVAMAPPFIALGIKRPSNALAKWPHLFSPIPASVVELFVVWGWHIPGPHHFARHTSIGFMLEQSSFFLSGLWLWLSCLYSRGQGILGLLLTSMHMTFLAALIGLSPRPLYHHSLDDQQLGGAIMVVMGGVSYLAGGLWLTYSIIKEARNEGPI